MSMEQEILIYIDDQNKLDASVAANTFANIDIKNRAYMNTLGAELVKKYLISENINITESFDMHLIKKVLENFDISDIILKGLHIDVRVIFNDNAIFVPKSHFDYNITPDIYVVLQISKDLVNAKLLGFFEPKLINKNNHNDKYYFIEKEKLSNALDLKEYIKSHQSIFQSSISDDELDDSEQIIISYIDNDIQDNEIKVLMKNLVKSSELREKFIEYENFEKLSHKAFTDSDIEKPIAAQDTVIQDEFDIFDSEKSKSSNEEKFTDDLNSDNTEFLELYDENNTDNIQTLDIQDTDVDNADDNDGINLMDIADDAAVAGIAAGAVSEIGALAENEIVSEIADTAETLADFSTLEVDENEDIKPFDETNEDIQTAEPEIEPIENIEETDSEPIDFTNDIQNVEENELQPLEEIEDVTEPETEEIQTTENINLEEPVIDSFEDIQTIEEPEIEPIDIQTVDEPEVQTDDIINESIEDIQPAEEFEATDDITFDNIDNNAIEDNSIDVSELEINTNSDDIENIEEISTSDTTEDDNAEISFESIEEASDKIEQTEFEPIEDAINFDEITEQSEALNEVTNPNTESLDMMSFEDVQETNQEETETFDETETVSLDDVSEFTAINEHIQDETVSFETLEKSVIDEMPEVFSDDETVDDNAFGKNLLENLSIEEENNVSIEEIDDMFSQNELPKDASDMTSEEITDHLNNAFGQSNFSEDYQTDDTSDITADIDYQDDNYDENIEAQSESENIGQLENIENEDSQDLNILYNSQENKEIQTELNDEINELDAINELEEITEPAQENSNYQIDNNFNIQSNKKPLIIASVLVIAAALAGFYFIKPKTTQQAPVQNEITDTVNENPISTQEKTDENLLSSNTPDVNNIEIPSSQTVQELKNNTTQPKNTDAYMSVSKLVWDVPDHLSKDTNFQNYLRTAGKSIKTSLTADLLLANEYAYSDFVKIGLKISKNGNLTESNIITSSGSKEIDNIVLQSVKDTLNVVKPANSKIDSPNFNLSIIIYF